MTPVTQKVKVTKKSGFDKSFQNLLTSKVGTLTPILCDELVPNTTVHLKAAINASLPPLASDTFMRCDLKAEAFFVPSRILYGGFESWMTGEEILDQSTMTGTTKVKVVIPYIEACGSGTSGSVKIDQTNFGSGTLSDYLGNRFLDNDISYLSAKTDTIKLNVFPYLAYHKIYDDWYRNTLVQNPLFNKTIARESSNYLVGQLPYENLTSAFTGSFKLMNMWTFRDNSTIFSLRQRNFGIDYFTNATPQAQLGTASNVSIPSGSTGFTISALRAANSLQQWMERNNLAGYRYVDYVKANYGADLSDGVAQRPLFLGNMNINVYSKGVNQTAPVDSGVAILSNNPFNTVGAQYGQASCTGENTLVDSFTTQEHGYLMVLVSLVPKVTYGSGVRRQNMHFTGEGSQSDIANALLQNVGNQPIYRGELNATDAVLQNAAVFGYTDRFAEYMVYPDEVHGLLRDGESLQSFALQRNFYHGQASIDSDFITIPTDYLDQVSAVDDAISDYGTWIDSYFDYKVSMPLAQYSVPSLQDPAAEHGEDVEIRRGGKRID